MCAYLRYTWFLLVASVSYHLSSSKATAAIVSTPPAIMERHTIYADSIFDGSMLHFVWLDSVAHLVYAIREYRMSLRGLFAFDLLKLFLADFLNINFFY